MSTDHHRYRRLVHRVAMAAACGFTAAAIVAVPATAENATTTPTSSPRFANGVVTSVQGTSVQVSNTASQSETTVVLRDSTTYTKRQTAGVSAIVIGACVRATGTGTTTKGITATIVNISAADANGCTGADDGPGGRDRPRRNVPNGRRSDSPNEQPHNGGPRNGSHPANFALASGPVVSVSGETITVKSTTFGRPTASSSKTKSKSSKSKTKSKTTTTKVVVTIKSSTNVEQTLSATAADVTVGKCMTATGTAGAGTVGATRVAISDPVNGACTSGFGNGLDRGAEGADGGNGAGHGTARAAARSESARFVYRPSSSPRIAIHPTRTTPERLA